MPGHVGFTFHGVVVVNRTGRPLYGAFVLLPIWILGLSVLVAQWHPTLLGPHLHDPDNHDAVITHLEPDILDCEVKWALGSTTMNKARRGDGIPVELFQILKDDAVKVLHSICQQIWKTQQWTQDWKRFQSQRKTIPNYFTIL